MILARRREALKARRREALKARRREAIAGLGAEVRYISQCPLVGDYLQHLLDVRRCKGEIAVMAVGIRL